MNKLYIMTGKGTVTIEGEARVFDMEGTLLKTVDLSELPPFENAFEHSTMIKEDKGETLTLSFHVPITIGVSQTQKMN